MDSVTHVVLGAALTSAVAAKPFGRKGIVIGAVLATLPDLDVFFHYDNPVAFFTYHRSFTHSLFFLTLVGPLIGTLLYYITQKCCALKKCIQIVWLCLLTHALLDAFTVYGTQLFWPLSPPPAMIGSIFIIDPLYTLPLLVAFVALLVNPLSPKTQRINRWGLYLSTAYLALSLCVQQYVVSQVKHYCEQHQITIDRVLATPTPFTIAAWRVVVVNADSYFEGFYGLLPKTREFSLTQYERRAQLLDFVRDAWAVKRLEWFSNGFYMAARENDKIYISDLRMGFEPNYSFSFYVAKREGANYVEIPNQRHPSGRRQLSDLGPFWCEKLWLPEVEWCKN